MEMRRFEQVVDCHILYTVCQFTVIARCGRVLLSSVVDDTLLLGCLSLALRVCFNRFGPGVVSGTIDRYRERLGNGKL
jgi:hypothetical protein